MNRRLIIVLRSLLGFIFIAGPLAAIFHLGEPALPPRAAAFAGALMNTGYMMPLLWSVEILCGLMLLTGNMVPVALVMLAPVIVNIAAFHAFLAPAGAAAAIIVVTLELLLAWQCRRSFAPLFSSETEPQERNHAASIRARTV